MESIGIRLKNARKKSGLTQVEAAKAAGVSDLTWRRIEDGTTVPDVNALENFARAAHEDVVFLLTGERKEEQRSGLIPVVHTIHAGELVQGIADEDVIEWIPSNVKDPKAFGLQVKGDSMLPEIEEDDVVICAPSKTFVNGRIYASVIGDGEATIKRVFRRRGHYELVPTNQEYDAITVMPENIIKLVRVVQIYRRL